MVKSGVRSRAELPELLDPNILNSAPTRVNKANLGFSAMPFFNVDPDAAIQRAFVP